MITYEPFWDYLDWHEISTYTLITKHHVSSSTIKEEYQNRCRAALQRFCKDFGSF